MKTTTKLIVIAVLFTSLVASSEEPEPSQSILPSNGVKLTESEPPKPIETYMLMIPSGGYLENMIMLTSIKSGSGSNAIAALVEILKSSQARNIVVTGKSDAITAASIVAAIKEMKGASSVSTIYFNGEQKYCNEVNTVAKDSGIQVNTSVAK